MSLTPEQFNKIATKEDLEFLTDKFVEKYLFNKRMDDLLAAIDGLAKKIVAHGRMQEAIDKLAVKVERLEKQKA